MNSFMKKLVFYLLAVWAISAAYKAIATNHRSPSIRFEEDPGVIEKILDKLDPSSGPRLKAKSAVLVDLESGIILSGKNEDKTRSIASLTKLVTAMVFLKTSPDLLEIATVTPEDRHNAGRTRLYSGQKLTLFDLFHLMLISSDNVAARVIARSTGFTNDEFVEKMNELAAEHNLSKTRFTEPSGLDDGNVSTASEFAVIFREALKDGLISEVISKRFHTYKALNNDKQYVAYNTNRFLYVREEVFGGKTGYIKDSGYCLALGVESGGRKLAAVILGAPSNGYRYRDAARLLAFANK
ncbi:MAG: D-alanyl-D-alanine carboxypeptidase [Candidatus Zixiibacteriota bacterium]|nr:MAG: D-alanyl-D-alanine carboxypeptidase [candidate division Zixibacteria bacterium]